MNESDKVRFAKLMLGVSEYYSAKISDAVIAIYWDALKGFDIESIDKAITGHLKSDTGQFMPKVSDIIKIIDGSSTDVAVVAWTKVEKAISAVGAYASVVFDDPIIMAVIRDMGSWSQLCHKRIDELPFIAKEFQQRYRHYKTTGRDTEHPKVLIGMAEAQNALGGFKSEPPVPIGNKDKARQVFLTGGSGQNAGQFVKLDAITNKTVKAQNDHNRV